MVSVIMLAYNHEKYIKQAIEGVLMQQTGFPVQLYLADDASTDRTTAICKEYAAMYPERITHLLNKNNIGPRLNYINAFRVCDTKYIAHCEGDDYWTDPLKLQKQFYFLESNNGYSICWTQYKVLKSRNLDFNHNNEGLTDPDWSSILENEDKFDVNLNNIFNPYATLTLTVMFRRDVIDMRLYKRLKHSKDNVIYCMCLNKGNGVILNFSSGVYRIHNTGTFSGMSSYKQRYSNYLSLNEIIRYIPKCRNTNLTLIRNSLIIQCFDLCVQSQRAGDIPQLLGIYITVLWYCKPADRRNVSNVFLKHMALLLKRVKTSGVKG